LAQLFAIIINLCSLYSSLVMLPCSCLFYVPYSPLGIYFPLGHGASILSNANYSLWQIDSISSWEWIKMLWDHWNVFTNRIARFSWNVFLGEWSNVAIIWFVLMNAYCHLFGVFIGPTISSSSRHGCHYFIFSWSFLLLVQSYFLPRI
jgi:hypothetical protein